MDGRRRVGFLSAVLTGAILLAGAVSASAQTGSATLTGTVADNVGVIPGATITATQAQTNVVRTGVTNDQGVFRIPALPPGRYAVKVEMDGFRPVSIEEFNLLANEIRELGRLVLTAGGVSETVTITAEVTPVQTASSQLTKNITGDTLVSVQVKGRDIFGMMKILPGVVDTTANRDYASWSSGRGLSINGGNSLNKNTTIDGVPVGEEGGDGTTHITPNIDAIGEVNVITSGYNAENGRQSSGLISIVTKSGTNQVRGSGWYNMRRDEWNKNDFFRIESNSEKPFFEVNIGGYSIGGPVVIPGVLSTSSQKKAYFFLSQEWTDDVRPTTVSRTNLPTTAQRNGDFSQTFYGKATASGDGFTGAQTLQVITDPLTGQPFAGNIIPANRFNPIGQAMLLLAPQPNGIIDPSNNNYWNSNDAQDRQPLHTRSNLVSRGDIVWSQNTRFSVRALFDRDNSITYNSVAPGIGEINNVFPGDLLTGSMSKVISPTLVNEATFGFSHNHWGFRIGKGAFDSEVYKTWWQENVTNPLTGQKGFYPPRLEPFGSYSTEPKLSRDNKDEWPYFPQMDFRGGNVSNMLLMRPAGSSGPLPRWNENFRYTFQNDLSWTKGRHNFKFGFSTERNSKTEPGSVEYTGQYNFGHDSGNPLSTGHGYANALLGVFTTYTERNDRIDREVRHWYSSAYAQDSWRLNSRMTLDYGLRVEHHGAPYEARNENSAFDPALWSAAQAPLMYMPACKTGVAGNQSCSSANQFAVDPRFPGVLLSRGLTGNIIPGTGSVTNGLFRNGLPNNPGNPDSSFKDGQYNRMPMFSWAPRVGFAWDVFGDGTTAFRASGGVFYNFINQGQYGPFNGGPLVSRVRTLRNGFISDIQDLAKAGTSFLESPQNTGLPNGFPINLYGSQIAPVDLQPEKNYQANVAFQRDLGFNTVAEIAYVTNIGRKFWRNRTTNNIPVYAYADPANLFNNAPIAANLIRRDYRGIGQISYLTTDEDVLNYNAMQLSVQRRLTKGLQMGMAYSLSKAEGVKGWDFVTEELGGKAGLRERYYGPPSATQEQDRRHILTINYSYQVPNPLPNVAVVKHVLKDWEASGVIQYLSGNAIDPVCNTNQTGVTNTDPSLSGVATRCELVAGQAIDAVPAWTGDPATKDAFRPHFNLAAFQRPLPNGGIGNLGNAPLGVLRHPNWQNWDFTLARRIPVTVGRGGSVRVQAQFYNVFNMTQFTTMAATYTFTQGNNAGNTNTQTGEYTTTTNPFNFGLTVRFDY